MLKELFLYNKKRKNNTPCNQLIVHLMLLSIHSKLLADAANHPSKSIINVHMV